MKATKLEDEAVEVDFEVQLISNEAKRTKIKVC